MSPVTRAQALLEAVWPLVSVVAWFLFMSNAEHVGANRPRPEQNRELHQRGVVMSNHLPTPAVEPISCQPWCREGDGHPGARAREAQWCFGVEHRVHLSTEPAELLSDGSTGQPYLNTHLLRQANDTGPRVFIGYGGTSGKSATLEEAR